MTKLPIEICKVSQAIVEFENIVEDFMEKENGRLEYSSKKYPEIWKS